MQMVYIKKEKIPLPVSSLVLMIVAITYKLVLVLVEISSGVSAWFCKKISSGRYAGVLSGDFPECDVCDSSFTFSISSAFDEKAYGEGIRVTGKMSADET